MENLTSIAKMEVQLVTAGLFGRKDLKARLQLNGSISSIATNEQGLAKVGY